MFIKFPIWKVRVLLLKDSGRKTPISNTFSATLIAGDDKHHSFRFLGMGVQELKLGDSTTALLSMLSNDAPIRPRVTYSMMEGTTKIGVIQIVDFIGG